MFFPSEDARLHNSDSVEKIELTLILNWKRGNEGIEKIAPSKDYIVSFFK